MFICLFIFFY